MIVSGGGADLLRRGSGVVTGLVRRLGDHDEDKHDGAEREPEQQHEDTRKCAVTAVVRLAIALGCGIAGHDEPS